VPNYNKVLLMGNLTRDPELRYTPSGKAVADISIAINRRTKTADGEQRDSVVFVEVTVWDRQAEVINEYFSKGQPIFIEGRLSLDEWTTKEGERRSKLRVVLERFEFITPRAGGQGRGPGAPARDAEGAAPSRGPAPAPPPRASEAEAEPFDDVPF
jgi:single-strand DNA-binding protein